MDVLIDNFVMSLDEKSNDAVSVRLKAWLDERPIEEGKLVLDFTSMPEIDLAGFRLLIARCAEWKDCGLGFTIKGELSSRLIETNSTIRPGHLPQETGSSLQNILEIYCASPETRKKK